MPDLPSGTVTFLFTDIEGSTRLWEQDPEDMRHALAHHDTIVRAAILAHGGHVFKTIGDQFCAAFATVSQAIAAAVTVQRALQAAALGREPSPVWQGGVRVRMALHTGAAELRDGDYFGIALSRVSRLLEAAHGGQVLLSAAAAQLAREALPNGSTLRDLGRHRLKHLPEPEEIFQLVHPEASAEFPPLRSLEAFAHNLPRQLTCFIGRESELDELQQRLSTAPLLTLTGTGGVGKTRLALQVAGGLLEEYPDGVWLVELGALTEAALVPQAAAAALGIREEPGRPLPATLADHLRPRRLLLLLDNCEHLLTACAQLAEALLRSCPHLQILATSREALGIAGEAIYRVPSLSLPGADRLPTVEDLVQSEAVQLFVERAASSQPRFAVTARNAVAIARVCQELDGIALAIELAAARVATLSVEQIAARLHDRFRLLTGGSRAALPRQQTLRAAIDWSFDLLSPPEQILLRRLSVFSRGWSLEAAEAVCADFGLPSPPVPIQTPNSKIQNEVVLDLLSRLVDRSLVVAEESAGGEIRYRLLETIRQYCRDRLIEAGEAAVVCSRHRDFFLRLAEQAKPQLAGAEQVAWLDRLETEHDNLRAALEWSVESGEVEVGLRFAEALGLFWYYRGHLAVGWDRVAGLLVLTRSSGIGSAARRAGVLTVGAVLAGSLGHSDAATALGRESLAMWRELGDPSQIAGALNILASEALCRGDLEAAHSFYAESLAIRRAAGSPAEIASSLLGLGHVARFQGDYQTARSLYRESLALGQQLKDNKIIAWSLDGIGRAALKQGELELAGSSFRESLVIWREQQNKAGIVRCLEGLAQLASAQGSYERIARLFGAAEALREAVRYPVAAVDRPDYDCTAAARAALGEARFAAAWVEGRAMPLEQVVAMALAEEQDA